MGCSNCNDRNKNDHQQEFDNLMIKKHGIERVENEWENKSMRKPKIWEMEELQDILETKLKEYE